ncbi:MAG: hypothetical protein ACK57D_09560 [Sphingobacteriales bacterium]
MIEFTGLPSAALLAGSQRGTLVTTFYATCANFVSGLAQSFLPVSQQDSTLALLTCPLVSTVKETTTVPEIFSSLRSSMLASISRVRYFAHSALPPGKLGSDARSAVSGTADCCWVALLTGGFFDCWCRLPLF